MFDSQEVDSRLLDRAQKFNEKIQNRDISTSDNSESEDSESEDSESDDLNINKMNIKNLDLGRIYFSFRKLLLELAINDRAVNPDSFIMACNQKVRNDDSIYSHLFNGSQNDVSEFIIFLLDVIRDIKSRKTKMSIQQQEIKTFDQQIKIDSFKVFIKYLKKIIVGL